MKFGIRNKLLLLIVLLSLALIIASVLISSRLYSSSLERSEIELCSETANSLVENIETLHLDFINKYRDKITAVYTEHREELEEAAETEFESFDKREEFYDAIVEGVFPPKIGFGLSYEMVAFKNEYDQLRNEIDILSFAGGLDVSSTFFYDAEHNNIVYLTDRMPEGSSLYNFPASVKKPWDEKLEAALKSGSSAEYIEGSECFALKSVEGAGNVFVLFAKHTSGIKQNLRLFTLYVFGILLGATLLIGLFTLLFADRLIVKNVKKLASATESFTSEIHGGCPEKVSAGITSSDEIGDLSQKFDLMQDSILGYIESLADKTSKEEKMKAELELAARIQQESLPKGGIKAGGASVQSFLKPAKEVGGDLYDHFMLDDTRMFFCLADVSGKGVPASLFMMRAKELIRAHVMTDNTLGELASKLNNELCAGNDESIFITAFFGVFDTKSGRLSYLSAGHERPLLRRGGSVEALDGESNYVLGVFEDMEYTAEEITLLPGDVLLMFTDGLNEGINEKSEAFGYDRIAAALKNADEDVTSELYGALLDFCGEAEQFDDVTMLALSYSGVTRIELTSPGYKDIPAVTDRVFAGLSGFDRDRVSEVGLIIDEIMNNQITYGLEGLEAPLLAVELCTESDTAVLTFEDNGRAFDPLSDVSDDDIKSSDGGYGLLLVKSLTDSQSYERMGDLNRLTVTKRMRGPRED